MITMLVLRHCTHPGSRTTEANSKIFLFLVFQESHLSFLKAIGPDALRTGLKRYQHFTNIIIIISSRTHNLNSLSTFVAIVFKHKYSAHNWKKRANKNQCKLQNCIFIRPKSEIHLIARKLQYGPIIKIVRLDKTLQRDMRYLLNKNYKIRINLSLRIHYTTHTYFYY